jgi:hypothetical protein
MSPLPSRERTKVRGRFIGDLSTPPHPGPLPVGKREK